MATHNKLLEYLEKNSGEYVSGADIASDLGVSGTAVWKAVRKLKALGHEIDAVTNKGYRLINKADLLSAAVITDHAGSDVTVEVFDEVISTNDICKDRAADKQKEVYIAVTDHQTGGRGRRGRAFYSPAGTGLYMSILLRPSGMSAERSLNFTTMAAAAVSQAIEEVSGKTAGIKWVNDIYMDGRKVCGILTEASFDLESGTLDYAVVGIGINVHTPEGGFPEEISKIAGAVCSEGETIDRNLLAGTVIRNFMRYYNEACSGPAPSYSYMDEYRKRSIVIGRKIQVLSAGSEPVNAEAIALDDSCRLIVRYEDGTEEALGSGEISIRL